MAINFVVALISPGNSRCTWRSLDRKCTLALDYGKARVGGPRFLPVLNLTPAGRSVDEQGLRRTSAILPLDVVLPVCF